MSEIIIYFILALGYIIFAVRTATGKTHFNTIGCKEDAYSIALLWFLGFIFFVGNLVEAIKNVA